ncbi:TPA: alpha/beta hydrolase [Elizabethkingia anophelis]|nr:alpha/beta hydrolase [Elizabethkingia anophelis]HBN6703086.1 alpha/beta hydrolase [Elizabethkingia anophelis]HBN6706897.1 alpha/beta hydrolase [Elizabethkingia anophelis]HBN6710929.1 alpha/beta hydrolase [Elizabethkingia anophelis]HBN6715044.1 alpha/beta hydrolase [Elizabethkingia anophelis]
MKKSVKFKALYWDISANLLFPPNFDENKKYPTIISTHPIGSCKEQTSGNVYGQALADSGFIVLVPDASFQGESGGEPRRMEDPSFRVQDYSYACDYLVTLSFVDENRIGVLGICGGGGYSISAAKSERRIKAVVSITGVNFGRLSREGFAGYDPIGTLEAIAEQRTAEAKGAQLRVDGLLPSSVEEGRKAGITDIDVLEATDYYKTSRGAQPNGAASALFSHRATAVDWDAFSNAETLLTQPLLIVIGDKPGGFGAYRDGQEIYGRAASKKKELVVVEGWSHYDLYDKPEPVKIALDKLIPFYKENL